MQNIIEIESSRVESGSLVVLEQRDAVTNGQSAPTARERTLAELAEEICEDADRGDERRIKAAMLLRELKLRISAGEAGPAVDWKQWVRINFKRSRTWIRDLDLIASAENPAAELRRIRDDGCRRQKGYRERHIEYDPVRREVMKMLKGLNSNQIRDVRQFIWRTFLN